MLPMMDKWYGTNDGQADHKAWIHSWMHAFILPCTTSAHSPLSAYCLSSKVLWSRGVLSRVLSRVRLSIT